jgi:hypothetical protein
VFGVLNSLDLNQLEASDIEAEIANDVVAQNFVRMMTVLDMLARLIRLTDLQTNGGNFGFVQPGVNIALLPLLKIIDFRVIAEKYFQRVHQGDWMQFLSGEGFFEDNLDERVEYALKTRDVNLRKALIADIFNQEFAHWLEVIDLSVAKVQSSIEQLTSILKEDKDVLLKKLQEDASVLKENYNFFQAESSQSE